MAGIVTTVLVEMLERLRERAEKRDGGFYIRADASLRIARPY